MSPTSYCGRPLRIIVSQTPDGIVSVTLNGVAVVVGVQVAAADVGGSIAVHAGSGSSIRVTEMGVGTDNVKVEGGSTTRVEARAGVAAGLHSAQAEQRFLTLTASEGVVGQGSADVGGWTPASSAALFHSRQGFESDGGNQTMLKWNFVGVACNLWLPKGPQYGTVSVSVDGVNATLLNLMAKDEVRSSVVFSWNHPNARTQQQQQQQQHRHALVVRWVSGGMAADSVDYLPPAIGMV